MVFGALSVGALAAEEEETIQLHSVPDPHFPFTDVRTYAWYFPGIEFVRENSIVDGTTSTTFSPNQNTSRAMVVTALFRVHHGRRANASDPRNTPFADVYSSASYAPYVAWANSNGIVEGYAGLFNPEGDVNRSQLAAMFHRFATIMTDRDVSIRQSAQWASFTDQDQIQSWAFDPLIWANYHGLVTGRTASTIAPRGTATRAEAATILTRFMGGSTELPPPVNFAPLLGQSFAANRHVFGRSMNAVGSVWDTMYRFDRGVLVAVENGRIESIQMDFRHGGSALFYWNGINNRSTQRDVQAQFGTPPNSDGISYTFWLDNGRVLIFDFCSHDQERVVSVVYSYVRMYAPEPD